MEILLTVIIPGYERYDYAEKLLKQLDKQMQDNVEVILVDDCSPIPYQFHYKWLKIIRLEENSQGASVPRNKGLDIAQGEYISFIDIDDMVSDNYIKTILDKTKEEWDYCYISWECSTHKIIIKDNPPKWNCCVWNCIYKKELIENERFKPELKMAEDYDFNNRVRKGKRANITKIIYYYNEDTPNSLTKQGELYNSKYKGAD